MRRLLTVLFTAVCLLFLATAVSADTDSVLYYLRSDLLGNESEFFAPGSKEIEKLNISASGYSFSGDIDSHKRQMTHGILAASANLYEPGGKEDRVFHGSSSLNLFYSGRGYDLSEYSVLRIGISAEAYGEDKPASYPFTLIAESSDGEVCSFSFDIPTGSWTLVSVDLRSVSGELSSISVSLDYDKTAVPDSFACSAPYLDKREDDVFANAERFSAEKLSASVGMIVPSSGRVRPADGYAEISGKLLAGLAPEIGRTAYISIVSGGMSIGLSYRDTTDEQRHYTKKIALPNSEDESRTVVFPAEILDRLESFTLYFSDVVCGSSFRINSITVTEGASLPAVGNYEIGTLSSLKRSGNSITFSGTMQRDAVRRFSGENISFYAIPSKSADDLSTAYLLGSVRMSTVFTYTADFSSLSGMADTFLFFAAVRETGNEGNLMPLSRPRYPDAAPLPGSNVSVIGFSDAASVGVFEANASHVSVDVNLSQLFTEAGDGTAVSYTDFDSKGGTARQIHFSYSLLAELDSEINFYISSGTRVYLRLTASDMIPELNRGNSRIPDLSVPGARYMWAAAVRFLASRYSEISGFILGRGVNDEVNISSSASMEELVSYTASLAELVRITYNASSPYIDEMPVIVPFIPKSGTDASVIALLLSDRLSDIGNMPWAMQWHITSAYENSDPQFTELAELRTRLEELDITLPAAYTFFLTSPHEAMLSRYGEYAEACRALGEDIPEYSSYAADIFSRFYEKSESFRAEAAFVSLEGHSIKHSHEFYSAVKNIGFAGKSAQERSVYGAEAYLKTSPSAYHYALFDFSDKQYPLGWIAGGGVESCLTEIGELFSDNTYTRVLRSEFSDNLGFVDNTGQTISGSAGIILRNLSRVYDFGEIDTAEFTLALKETSETSAECSITLVFVIGSDDYRAEYYAAEVKAGEILTYSCDLTKFEHRNAVDYIGIMTYSDAPVVMELAGVRVGSDTLAEEQLGEMFRQAEAAEEQDLVSAGLVIAFTAVCSVIAIVILTHHDREEDERREAALAEASRYRRNRR